MGMNAVKVKILPESPEIDLKEVGKEIREKIESKEGKINKIEENEIAFGLKALIVTLAWPESQDSDVLENLLNEIKGVSSVEIVDFRRAFG